VARKKFLEIKTTFFPRLFSLFQKESVIHLLFFQKFPLLFGQIPFSFLGFSFTGHKIDNTINTRRICHLNPGNVQKEI
jgi:hypothetical protein